MPKRYLKSIYKAVKTDEIWTQWSRKESFIGGILENMGLAVGFKNVVTGKFWDNKWHNYFTNP